MATVGCWGALEVRALRQARRLSVRAFAEHLGVAVRTVSKWEAVDQRTRPRPDTQAILDTALMRADVATQKRFELLLSELLAADSTSARTRSEEPPESDGGRFNARTLNGADQAGVDRRDVLKLGAVACITRFADLVETEPGQMQATLTTGSVSESQFVDSRATGGVSG